VSQRNIFLYHANPYLIVLFFLKLPKNATLLVRLVDELYYLLVYDFKYYIKSGYTESLKGDSSSP